ncbi:hypothetical protein [Sediminibacterium sp.]|uniref:hypothetical protein n=1 Tax=Sediminibacterium sp. TaxID=1917865 RepID=UPI002720F8C9|nr:hypothetical protein [Sediminibacterium sp.]MDO8997872.1 hypothetical protein [Sediminibacterium sp.]MDP1974280.1 hypothetical protein [Sediminibacterium sp.]MDP2421025.1 hypothetical protein [Sediminibacterium sp.]
MKKIILAIALFTTFGLNAQTKYESAMQNGFSKMKDSKTADEMSAVASFFERVGDAEKTQWLPYYYAARNYTIAAFMNPAADKDKAAEKVKDLIAKAEAIENANAEIFCLKQQVAVMQLVVDPMSRWQSYGAVAAEAIAKAKAIEPNNPRPYLLEGQYLMNVPEAFGGGKAIAKKLFEKSVELFGNYKPASQLHPSWGKEQAEQLLAACQ